jgi:hypothetical protein
MERRDAAFARAGRICEVSTEPLGFYRSDGTFDWVWRRACHHVIAERFARRWLPGCDVHMLANLVVVTPQLHSRLTSAENRLFRVDVVGYKQELDRLGVPPDIFDYAWTALCESVEKK